MNDLEENEERIVYLCKHMSNGRSFFKRADMDELALRVNASRGKLPSRFVNLVMQNDEIFGRLIDDDLQELSARLRRILDLAATLNLEKGAVELDDELLPTFQLSGDDKVRVLSLCGEMRRIVFESDIFDNAHKRRLANRISAIERQVHQPNGLFDVILGGISDVGEVLGKFGTDVKPLTDRMSEIAKIARDGAKQYEGLPAPEEQKRLPAPKE